MASLRNEIHGELQGRYRGLMSRAFTDVALSV